MCGTHLPCCLPPIHSDKKQDHQRSLAQQIQAPSCPGQTKASSFSAQIEEIWCLCTVINTLSKPASITQLAGLVPWTDLAYDSIPKRSCQGISFLSALTCLHVTELKWSKTKLLWPGLQLAKSFFFIFCCSSAGFSGKLTLKR